MTKYEARHGKLDMYICKKIIRYGEINRNYYTNYQGRGLSTVNTTNTNTSTDIIKIITTFTF